MVLSKGPYVSRGRRAPVGSGGDTKCVVKRKSRCRSPLREGCPYIKGLTDLDCHLISAQEIQNSRQMRGETERPLSPACASD